MAEEEYTKEGVEKLYNLACKEYCIRKYPLDFLYRNKRSSYFENIIKNQDGVMLPYLKDAGNDKFNPMNERLGGLYFATFRSQSSLFGDTRLTIPATRLLDNKNLYFADYFCLRGEIHFINIVACTPNSKTDKFCQEKLFKLSRSSNRLLNYEDGVYKVINSKCLKVEITITDAINIKEELKASKKAFIEYGIRTTGSGCSTPRGIPKKSHCTTCNFDNHMNYTQKRSNHEVKEEINWKSGKAESFSFGDDGKYIYNGESDGCWIIHEDSQSLSAKLESLNI